MNHELVFDCSAAPEAADLAAVDAGLDAHNQAEPALGQVVPLGVFARDAAGHVQGGAVGRTWGACCELQQLWVAEAWRRQGVATGLLERFEQAARARGCALVYLDSFSFQAPAFYAGRGYRVALRTRGYTQGIVKYTLHKRLDPPGRADPAA